jgi:hypothetical protein
MLTAWTSAAHDDVFNESRIGAHPIDETLEDGAGKVCGMPAGQPALSFPARAPHCSNDVSFHLRNPNFAHQVKNRLA